MGEYRDAFKISLPPHYRLLKNTGSQHELRVHDFVKQFFDSKIFRRFEGPLIKKFLKDDGIDDQRMIKIKAFRFALGDEYLVWRVVARERDEVLLRWEVAGFHGCTWFYIPHNENAMVFGSSFPLPLDTKERQHTSLPKKLFIDASRNLPA